MEQGADAAAADHLLPLDSNDWDPPAALLAAESTHNEREEPASTASGAGLPSGTAQPSTLTMLDVAVAWRELPAGSKDKELALLHVLHAKAHGASCTCSTASCKAHAGWRAGIRPATRDRKPVGQENRARWEQQPFKFDFYTMGRRAANAKELGVGTICDAPAWVFVMRRRTVHERPLACIELMLGA